MNVQLHQIDCLQSIEWRTDFHLRYHCSSSSKASSEDLEEHSWETTRAVGVISKFGPLLVTVQGSTDSTSAARTALAPKMLLFESVRVNLLFFEHFKSFPPRDWGHLFSFPIPLGLNILHGYAFPFLSFSRWASPSAESTTSSSSQ